jgi:hypothetical protein
MRKKPNAMRKGISAKVSEGVIGVKWVKNV